MKWILLHVFTLSSAKTVEAWSLYPQHCEPDRCYSKPDHKTQLGYAQWNINMDFFSGGLLELAFPLFSLL